MENRFGPYLVANITIDVALRIAEADAVSTATERELLSEVKMFRKVYVHCHPLKNEGPVS